MGETLFEQLVNMGLPIKNMNGQEYYNGSNMQRKWCTKEVLDICGATCDFLCPERHIL